MELHEQKKETHVLSPGPSTQCYIVSVFETSLSSANYNSMRLWLARAGVLLSSFIQGTPLALFFNIDVYPGSRSGAILLFQCFSPDVTISPVYLVMCPTVSKSVAQANTQSQMYERQATDVPDNFQKLWKSILTLTDAAVCLLVLGGCSLSLRRLYCGRLFFFSSYTSLSSLLCLEVHPGITSSPHILFSIQSPNGHRSIMNYGFIFNQICIPRRIDQNLFDVGFTMTVVIILLNVMCIFDVIAFQWRCFIRYN